MEPTDFVKAMLVPGSVGFLLIGLTVGLCLLLAAPRVRRWGLGWLSSLAVLYWALSFPVTASALEGMVDTGLRPLTSADPGMGEVAIVLLGGGAETFRADGMTVSSPSEATALRSLEAVRLYRLSGGALILASGGPGGGFGGGEPESTVMRRLLEANGIPPDDILEESQASSTREEAVLLAGMLAELKPGRIIVVTSPSHMRRALGALAAEGIRATGSPSLERSDPVLGASRFAPGERALAESRQALREMMALIYYAAHGWLAPLGTP